MKAKRNAFAAVGWTVWQAGAKIGVPYAKKRLREGRKRDVTIEVKHRK